MLPESCWDTASEVAWDAALSSLSRKMSMLLTTGEAMVVVSLKRRCSFRLAFAMHDDVMRDTHTCVLLYGTRGCSCRLPYTLTPLGTRRHVIIVMAHLHGLRESVGAGASCCSTLRLTPAAADSTT